MRETLVSADRLEENLAFEPELSCVKNTSLWRETDTPRFTCLSFVFHGPFVAADVLSQVVGPRCVDSLSGRATLAATKKTTERFIPSIGQFERFDIISQTFN